MQRGTGGRDDFFGFGDPFAGFRGFGHPGSLTSSFFGGRDPFDDPFFTHPFGSMMGPSMFGPSMFHSGGSLFGEASNNGFLEQQPVQHNGSKGPIIQELSSDDDGGEKTAEEYDDSEKQSRSTNHPYVQNPNEEAEENKRSHVQYRNKYNRSVPQAHTYSFQSSTVTYGGLNGAYYTSSTTRRMGGDGVTVEESKEADTTTGKATHRVSKGIRDKGHSMTRKLNSDGKVDTLQTLHNLNEDELAGFEEEWKGNARQHLPGWNPALDMLDIGKMGSSSSSRRDERSSVGWALPSTEQPFNSGRMKPQSQPDSFNGRT